MIISPINNYIISRPNIMRRALTLSLALLAVHRIITHSHLRRPFLLYRFIPKALSFSPLSILLTPRPHVLIERPHFDALLLLLRSRSQFLHSPSTPCNENKTLGLLWRAIPSSSSFHGHRRTIYALEIALLSFHTLLCCCCCLLLLLFAAAD
jgi:hypothetical protein